MDAHSKSMGKVKAMLIIRQLFLALLVTTILSNSIFAQDTNKVNQTPKVFGRTLLIFYHTDKTPSNGDRLNNDIYFKNIDIGLKGTLLEYLRYKVSIKLDKKSLKFTPLDAYCAVKFFSFAEILIGQFKPPFSMERLISSPKRDFLNSAIATGFVPSRDIGVALFGETNYIEFNLGVLNGTGLNKPEDNSKKDLVGRLVLKSLKWTKIGGAVYWGWQGPDTNIIKKRRYNLQAEFKNPKFHIRTEYVATEDGSVKGGDYYIQSGYKIATGNKYLQKLEPLLRYERYNPDRNTQDKLTVITSGINAYFDDVYRFRSQINYSYEHSDGISDAEHKIYIGLQICF